MVEEKWLPEVPWEDGRGQRSYHKQGEGSLRMSDPHLSLQTLSLNLEHRAEEGTEALCPPEMLDWDPMHSFIWLLTWSWRPRS